MHNLRLINWWLVHNRTHKSGCKGYSRPQDLRWWPRIFGRVLQACINHIYCYTSFSLIRYPGDCDLFGFTRGHTMLPEHASMNPNKKDNKNGEPWVLGMLSTLQYVPRRDFAPSILVRWGSTAMPILRMTLFQVICWHALGVLCTWRPSWA